MEQQRTRDRFSFESRAVAHATGATAARRALAAMVTPIVNDLVAPGLHSRCDCGGTYLSVALAGNTSVLDILTP